MGFITRLLIPRKVRRIAHPVRAITPRPIKKVQRLAHPVSNLGYAVERSLTQPKRRSSSTLVYRHGSCPVKHRSIPAAANCRR